MEIINSKFMKSETSLSPSKQITPVQITSPIIVRLLLKLKPHMNQSRDTFLVQHFHGLIAVKQPIIEM